MVSGSAYGPLVGGGVVTSSASSRGYCGVVGWGWVVRAAVAWNSKTAVSLFAINSLGPQCGQRRLIGPGFPHEVHVPLWQRCVAMMMELRWVGSREGGPGRRVGPRVVLRGSCWKIWSPVLLSTLDVRWPVTVPQSVGSVG